MPPSRRKPAGLSPLDLELIGLAPLVLVKGSEGYFVDSVTDHLTNLAKARDADVEITRIDAGAYQAHELDMLTSPSLFEERRHLIVDAVDSASDAFIADAVAYLDQLDPEAGETTMVLRHTKGVRGKKLLDAIAAAKFPVVQCDPLKRDSEKVDFVSRRFRDARRRASADAVRGLVEALGSDLRELAAGVQQLIDDTTSTISADVVQRYYGGRVEATGFRVADTAVAGDGAAAVTLLRHALSTGLDPVPIVAVLAMKLRTLAKVAAMRGRTITAKELGLAPWQVDRARRELRGWTPEGLATAITAVADADAHVKGESREPQFAVERAVLRVAAARDEASGARSR
ncbi:MAG: DNA polymerase III subunit delta [Beutenbergiaceae bacterium]